MTNYPPEVIDKFQKSFFGRISPNAIDDISPRKICENFSGPSIREIIESVTKLMLNIEEDRKNNDIKRNWEFHIADEQMILPSEVAECISRANPIAIVKLQRKEITEDINDESDVMEVIHEETDKLVFVHESIINKMKVFENCAMPNGITKVHFGCYMFISDKSIPEITAWAKEIKNRQWGEKKKMLKARVIIPNI